MRSGLFLFILAALLLPIQALAQGCGSSSLSCVQLAIQDAQAAGVDPATFVAQIQAESNFNPNAINNASGATGIAQFLPSTAANAGFGIAAFDPTDPVAALQAAAQYDAALAARDGSLTAALTDYSGGLTPANPGGYAQVFADAAAADAGNPQAIAGATVTPTSSVTVGGGGGGAGAGALGGQTIVTDFPGTGSGAGSDVLDQFIQSFQGAMAGWQTGLLRIATDLFWLLAGIDLIASLIALVMGAGRPDWFDVVATILHWLFPSLLFLWLMNNAPTFMSDIVQSFQQAGTAIGGAPITPSAIFWAGVNIITTIYNNMHGFLDAIHEIPVMLAAIPIIIAFSLAAVWMLMVLIEAYFRIGLAALFFAFGGMRWTRNIATSLVMSCVAVGFKLLAMELIVAVVGSYAIGWAQHAAGLSFQGIFVMIGASFVFAALVKLIPDSLERIVYGHIHSYTYHQATGMVRNEATAGLALAAAPVAGMAGFGMLAWQLIKHAAESEVRGTPQIEGTSRGGAATLAAMTAAGSEIGGRLGGLYRGGIAASLARMSGNVGQQRAIAAAQAARPMPPQGGSP